MHFVRIFSIWMPKTFSLQMLSLFFFSCCFYHEAISLVTWNKRALNWFNSIPISLKNEENEHDIIFYHVFKTKKKSLEWPRVCKQIAFAIRSTECLLYSVQLVSHTNSTKISFLAYFLSLLCRSWHFYLHSSLPHVYDQLQIIYNRLLFIFSLSENGETK